MTLALLSPPQDSPILLHGLSSAFRNHPSWIFNASGNYSTTFWSRIVTHTGQDTPTNRSRTSRGLLTADSQQLWGYFQIPKWLVSDSDSRVRTCLFPGVPSFVLAHLATSPTRLLGVWTCLAMISPLIISPLAANPIFGFTRARFHRCGNLSARLYKNTSFKSDGHPDHRKTGTDWQMDQLSLATIYKAETASNCELALDVLYIYDYRGMDVAQAIVLDENPIFRGENRYLPLATAFVNISGKKSLAINFEEIVQAATGSDFKEAQLSSFFALSKLNSLLDGIAILVIRIWAIYGRSKVLIVILGVLGCLQLAASSAIVGISISQGSFLLGVGISSIFCVIFPPHYFGAYWIPILAFEVTLFILTLIKGLENFRRAKVFALSGTSGQALLSILVRDSVLYFFMRHWRTKCIPVSIAAVYATNMAVWYSFPSLYQASSAFGTMIPPMLASKLLFSLRAAFEAEKRSKSSAHEMLVFAQVPASSSGQPTGGTHNTRGDRWDEWGGAGRIPVSLDQSSLEYRVTDTFNKF
ncbi:hypothetical protein FB451DRAFT_1533629 [Mycena latifolia]|nr:hypothetical protein FB451DRAFT_1533629 [Mycena latifolia]